MSYGLIAVIIVIGIVIGAIATKKCEPFLIGGSIIGAIFLYKQDFITEWVNTLEGVMSDEAYLILVCGLFGSIIALLTASKGHFGIASKYYCHFTSPIRRYPDLFIHRIISKYLDNDYLVNDFWIKKYEKRAEKRAENCSERERVATKVEREAEDIKKAEFMESKIGEEYEGIVSSVTNFGIFVELDNTVEGLIRYEKLGDEYFIYNEEKRQAIGEHTGKVYQIGDKVKIRVANASKLMRQIDFEICEEKAE